jgi:hypothetical protein
VGESYKHEGCPAVGLGELQVVISSPRWPGLSASFVPRARAHFPSKVVAGATG